MDIVLDKANRGDAALIYNMQHKAFSPLLEKYQDYEKSPANESVEKIIARMNQSFTEYYIIKLDHAAVGGIRIVKKGNHVYRVSPVFVIPEHQGKGIAQKVFALIEQIYADAHLWELDTIMEEKANCYLYEKLGYRQTGESKRINEKMTIVFYEKRLVNKSNEAN